LLSKPGEGFAPLYDYKKALTLFPKKPLAAGAKRVALAARRAWAPARSRWRSS
jgi:hypothetical protein